MIVKDTDIKSNIESFVRNVHINIEKSRSKNVAELKNLLCESHPIIFKYVIYQIMHLFSKIGFYHLTNKSNSYFDHLQRAKIEQKQHLKNNEKNW